MGGGDHHAIDIELGEPVDAQAVLVHGDTDGGQAGGATGQLAVNWSDESFRKMSTKISVWGANGRLVADRQECQLYLREAGMTQAEAFKLGNPRAKMRVHLIAESFVRAVPYGDRPGSPYRILYEERKAATEGRGVDATIDAVGHPDALELACRITRKAGTVSATGVYAERIEVHMGIVWIKALTLKTGFANVIKHVDPVLEALTAGTLDPTPLVTHHMGLDEAPDAYGAYDRREALKIVLAP